LINKVSTPAVGTSTEFDLRVLIDLIGLMTKGAGMSVLASGPLGRERALFFFNTERSRLTVRSALGSCERLLELGDALCFDFQLLVQRSVLGPQSLDFGSHLGQALSLPERGLK
jgi:hypothetical protein